MPMRAVYLLLASLLAAPAAALAETAYVSDKVFIDVRGGPNYENPVVHKMLAGTTLEVLDKVGDFTRIRDGNGREGWIENRELTAEVPARLRYATLERELAGVRAELARTQEQLGKTQAVLDEDDADRKALIKAQAKLKRQLASTRSRLAKSREKLEQAQAARLAKAEAAADQPEIPPAPALPAPMVAADAAGATAAAQTEAQPDTLSGMPETGRAEGGWDGVLLVEPDADSGFKQRFLDFVRALDFVWLGISFAMLVIGFAVGAVWLRERNRRRLGGMYLRI
ncbi:MAG: hypothetical protein BMS9Abin10_0389 [Gammaproteobacteria bacterium]|nr:MAG: hypothetical protein BMS9Abin10_0389 [Gammaproteobacteria bacterium]